MNRTTLIFFSLFMALSLEAKAQLIVKSDALVVQEGTVFFVDGLTMVPASNLSINNNDLEKHKEYKSMDRIKYYGREH